NVKFDDFTQGVVELLLKAEVKRRPLQNCQDIAVSLTTKGFAVDRWYVPLVCLVLCRFCLLCRFCNCGFPVSRTLLALCLCSVAYFLMTILGQLVWHGSW